MTAPFTPEQEARIREIVREEIARAAPALRDAVAKAASRHGRA